MKAVVGSVIAAAAASVCCIGPVVAAVLGAGALGAASVRFEPYRPWFLGLTVILLGFGFVSAYRRKPECNDGTCAPSSGRTAKIARSNDCCNQFASSAKQARGCSPGRRRPRRRASCHAEGAGDVLPGL